jgi:hypothetical protein
MKQTEQLQSVTTSRGKFTLTLTTHQQWLSQFTFIFLQNLVVAYRFISQQPKSLSASGSRLQLDWSLSSYTQNV